MLNNYEKFLEEIDLKIGQLFENHKQYIKCKKGCSLCCKQGEFPYSQLEFTYLTQGYLSLSNDKKIIIQNNIKNLLEQRKNFNGERFEHDCPFLINDECSVYKYRGIICRTFGICYYDDIKKYVRLPGCVHYGLNYSEYYDKESKTLDIVDIPKSNLRIDVILNSKDAKKYGLESGEIRPMIDWIK